VKHLELCGPVHLASIARRPHPITRIFLQLLQ